MNSKTKFLTVLILTLTMAVGCVVIVPVIFSYLNNYEPTGDNLPNETVVHYDEEGNTVVLTPKDEEKNYNFLVMGHDRAAMLTDVIMLVNFNVTEGKISLMQFPRDTYVSYGVATSRINVSYSSFYYEAVNNGSGNPELVAMRKFADVLEKALCTKISYCAIMDLNGFVSIVDAIGGVEMNVPERMEYYDEDQGLYINLNPGYQTLTGAQAEQFVRFRAGYVQADLGRQDAQKIFMSAFLEKIMKSVNTGNMMSLAETVLGHLDTDINVSELVYFGKALLGVDMSEISMFTLPINAANTGHVVMVEKLAADIINKHFNVYDGEITASIFDKDNIFVTYDNASISEAYLSDTALVGGIEYNAEDVNEESIYIP